jgi:DNA-binding MarR family transcriptional regulator
VSEEEFEERLKTLQAFVKHYKFLEIFLDQIPHSTLSELARITGKDMAYLSRLVKKLVSHGLLMPCKKEVDGKIRKGYALSALGNKLFKLVEEVFKPSQEESKEVEPWKVVELLKIVEGDWSEELRYKCASKLFELVDKNPVALLSKCPSLRKRFEDWLTSPPLDGKVGERLRAAVYCSIARLVQDESTRDWVLSSLYPRMRELLRHPSPEVNRCAASMLMDVALYCGSPEKRAEVVDLFLSVLLDKDVDLDKEPYNYVVAALSQVVAKLAGSEKERFLDRLKSIADEGRKQEVERLLDQLILRIF